MTTLEKDQALQQSEKIEFAHNSERQFALLLDFYVVPWDYEPRSFPLAWDQEGEPTKLFTPDFYLPDEDIYIEVTTMNQKLVTKKNQKVRLLSQFHPKVRCKILYQRDYLHLVVKYGLEEPDQLDDMTAPTRIPGSPQICRVIPDSLADTA